MDPRSELLAQLEALELPQRTGLWLAPGWWLLLLLLVVCGWLVYSYLRRRSRGVPDWRPQARAELQRIRQSLASGGSESCAPDLSRLIRRMVLAVRPREEIAALTDQDWLAELDRLCGDNRFSQRLSGVLLNTPYQPPVTSTAEGLGQLLDLTEAAEHLLERLSEQVDEPR